MTENDRILTAGLSDYLTQCLKTEIVDSTSDDSAKYISDYISSNTSSYFEKLIQLAVKFESTNIMQLIALSIDSLQYISNDLASSLLLVLELVMRHNKGYFDSQNTATTASKGGVKRKTRSNSDVSIADASSHVNSHPRY